MGKTINWRTYNGKHNTILLNTTSNYMCWTVRSYRSSITNERGLIMLKLVVDNTEEPIKVDTEALDRARGVRTTPETYQEKQDRLAKERKASNEALRKSLGLTRGTR